MAHPFRIRTADGVRQRNIHILILTFRNRGVASLQTSLLQTQEFRTFDFHIPWSQDFEKIT